MVETIEKTGVAAVPDLATQQREPFVSAFGRLAAWYRAGLLSDDEYEVRRREILDALLQTQATLPHTDQDDDFDAGSLWY